MYSNMYSNASGYALKCWCVGKPNSNAIGRGGNRMKIVVTCSLRTEDVPKDENF